MSDRQSALVLEDGTVVVGRSFGAGTDVDGEVVFCTAMTGYQEICTDPSYRGQMVVLTHPQVGNYGVSYSAEESARPLLTALLVRELADYPHHWESRSDNSCFAGRRLRGRVLVTVAGGRVAYRQRSFAMGVA